MVWDVSYTCDICGRKKGEANHWWMLTLKDVPCFDEGQPGKRFTLMPWDANESQSSDLYHVCGQSCAMQAMERFMNTGAILAEMPVETPAEREDARAIHDRLGLREVHDEEFRTGASERRMQDEERLRKDA